MKHRINFRHIAFLAIFLCIVFAFLDHPFGEQNTSEKENKQTEEKKEPAEKSKDDINKYIIESETGVYYIVQKGDTLWDLSRRFSDTPYVWPDLWEENKQITNPHLIYPGEKIRLYRKKDTNELVKKVEEKEPEKPKVPEVEPEPEEEKPYYFYSAIDSIGFIKEKAIKPTGYIFKVKEDKVLISFGDLIYVSPYGKASLDVGNKYTLYRTIKPIKGASTKTYPGTQYYLTGVIEILKKEDRFSVAKVIQSFRTIKTDDLLMPYEKQDPKIYYKPSKMDLKGKIIVAEENLELFGDDFVAFINKGSRDGVEVGQRYSVYYQDKERIKQSTGLFSHSRKTTLTPVDFATILVLHTEERNSTVLVTQADNNVYPDATFRAAEE